MSLSDSYAYCSGEVRRFDYDRYLTLMFAPRDYRPALAALYAFNLEVAKTREVVSEAMLGQMRLQWWREAIDGIYAGRTRQHDVVAALADAVAVHALPRDPFERLLDARERDLADAPPEDMSELLAYAEATSGSLVRQSAQVLVPGDASVADAAERAGTAWALGGLTRAVPFHARARRSYLPRAVMATAGLTETALFGLRRSPELRCAVEIVANAAAEEAAAARDKLRGAGQPAAPIEALLSLNDLYLTRLRGAGFDVYAHAARVGNLRKQAHLMWRSLSQNLI